MDINAQISALDKIITEAHRAKKKLQEQLQAGVSTPQASVNERVAKALRKSIERRSNRRS